MDVFCFGLSKLFVNSGATDIVLVTLSSTAVERAIAQCTSRWAMARGHRLNTSIVLAAVHGLSGLFRAVSAVEPFTLSSPSHSVPVPNKPYGLCGRKATLNLNCCLGQIKEIRKEPYVSVQVQSWTDRRVGNMMVARLGSNNNNNSGHFYRTVTHRQGGIHRALQDQQIIICTLEPQK